MQAQVQPSEYEQSTNSHQRYFARLLARYGRDLRGPRRPAFMKVLRTEHQNILQALEFALQAQDPEDLFSFARYLSGYLDGSGLSKESEDYYTQFLATPEAVQFPDLKMAALVGLG